MLNTGSIYEILEKNITYRNYFKIILNKQKNKVEN